MSPQHGLRSCLLLAVLLAALHAEATATHGSNLTQIPKSSSQRYRAIKQIDPSCAPSCAADIAKAINACGQGTESDGPCLVQLSVGTFPLEASNFAPAIVASGAGNVILTGASASEAGVGDGGVGTVLVAQNASAFFALGNIAGLTIQNIALEMARLPYTHGPCVQASSDGLTLQVNMSTYPFPSSPSASWLYQVQSILEYDTIRRRPALSAFDQYLTSNPATLVVDEQQSTVTVKGDYSHLTKGSTYILRHIVYGLNAFNLNNCSQVVFDNVDIRTAAGMGIYASFTTDISLNNVRVRKVGDRPMSITADACHFNACRGSIRITNSLFEGQGDDGLNVHSKFDLVDKIVNPTTISLQASTSSEHMGFMAWPGDTVEFRKRDTFQPFASGAILASVNTTHAVFTEPLPPSVQPGDVLTSMTWMPSFYASNNTYRNNRARCQLIKTYNVVVENNVYDGCSGPAVQVATDVCYWFESHPVRNWTVRHNSFRNLNYGPAKQSSLVFVTACTPSHPNLDVGQVHENVAVVGNQFDVAVPSSSPSQAVAIWASNGTTIVDNVVANASSPAIATTSCIQVNIQGNACTSPSGQHVSCN